jgi:primosomal protein N'
MIADVAFDAPLPPFSYRVPEGWVLAPGQRVLAELHRAARVGVVVALREAIGERLKPLLQVIDPAPLLPPPALDLARWVTAESLSSTGSAWLALLPPPAPAASSRGSPPVASESTEGSGRPPRAQAQGATTPSHASDPTLGTSRPGREVAPPRESSTGPAPPAADRPAGWPATWERAVPELLVGSGREVRLLDRVGSAVAALVLVPDVETAGRWAQRLARLGRVVRLDSGAPEAERAAGWRALADGTARLAVGTRSALLAPLPPGAIAALVDEHEAAHRPPGPPRIHAREVVLERGAREGLRVLLTSATPSAEAWWRCDQGMARLDAPAPAPWPAFSVTDVRGIARREALGPALARAIRETLAAGRRVFLVVSRLTSALGCDECGTILRCAGCAVALAYSPAARALACRICGESVPLPDTCPGCRGRRLAPFGWGAERVEQAVRRRFPKARVARYDPDAARGRRAEAQRAAAQTADVVVGTRGALRLFGPASLGLAGFVSPDQLLGLPDFRAAERAFALLWAAAERVRPDGAVIVQSQNPEHYALTAAARQDLKAFYEPELRFRAELGYPPFRRLAVLTVGGRDADAADRMAVRLAEALRRVPALVAYPPLPDRRRRTRRIVVKGGPDLPGLLGAVLADLRREPPGSRGIIDVEVDPVEWPF